MEKIKIKKDPGKGVQILLQSNKYPCEKNCWLKGPAKDNIHHPMKDD